MNTLAMTQNTLATGQEAHITQNPLAAP